MKNILYSIIIVMATIGFVACDNVNTMHDKYLANGEKFYVGKVDSFKIYGGKNRAKFVVWVGDYRSTNILVSRIDTSLTYNLKLSETNRKDSMVFYIDQLKEGSNVLSWNTWNADGTVSSIPQGTTVTTWGDRFQTFLSNRKMVSVSYKALFKAYTVTWDANNVKEPSFSTYALGHEIKYTTNSANDTLIQVLYDPLAITTPTTTTKLPNYQTTSGQIKYRMLFKPVALCIDTFRTEYSTFSVQ